MKRIVPLIFLSASFVSSCAYMPDKIQKVAVPNNSRIGILASDFQSTITHVHIGTTVLSNFTKDYQVRNDIQHHVIERASDDLRHLGYNPVVIDLNGQDADAIYNSKSPDVYLRLQKQYGIAMLISFKSMKYPVFDGIQQWAAGNYGLFSRTFLTFNRFSVYVHISSIGISTNPYGITEKTSCCYMVGVHKLEGINAPADLHDLPETEMIKVESAILEKTDVIIDVATHNAVSPEHQLTLPDGNTE